jgi:hypothetical protein
MVLLNVTPQVVLPSGEHGCSGPEACSAVKLLTTSSSNSGKRIIEAKALTRASLFREAG